MRRDREQKTNARKILRARGKERQIEIETDSVRRRVREAEKKGNGV